MTGNQSDIDYLTNELLSGRKTIRVEWLQDERNFPTDIVFRYLGNQGELYQLGVEQVSDYFLCVLEILHNTSSKDILGKIGSNRIDQCELENMCEVCNSSTYPLDPSLRSILVKYWTEYLDNN